MELKDEQYLTFLKEYSNKPSNTKLSNDELEVLYHLLFVLGQKITESKFREIINPIYINFLLPHIRQ
jgi:hypothetical protein